jgi:hypothetical protein
MAAASIGAILSACAVVMPCSSDACHAAEGNTTLENAKMFAIHSSSSDRKVRFLDRRGDEFVVELAGRGVAAAQWVSAFTDSKGLAQWMEELAANELPWKGTKSWATLESEFKISATCTSGGAVTFMVTLSGFPGSSEEWRVSAGIESELGHLPALAQAARHFFEDIQD